MTTLEIVLIVILYLSGGIFTSIKQDIFINHDKENMSPVGALFFWPIVLLYRFIKKVIVDPWD